MVLLIIDAPLMSGQPIFVPDDATEQASILDNTGKEW
jgi:hypothetical protein